MHFIAQHGQHRYFLAKATCKIVGRIWLEGFSRLLQSTGEQLLNDLNKPRKRNISLQDGNYLKFLSKEFRLILII